MGERGDYWLIYVVDSGQVCCGGVGWCVGGGLSRCIGAWEKVQLCMQCGECGCLRYMSGGGGVAVLGEGQG